MELPMIDKSEPKKIIKKIISIRITSVKICLSKADIFPTFEITGIEALESRGWLRLNWPDH